MNMAFSPTLSHMDMVRPPSEGAPAVLISPALTNLSLQKANENAWDCVDPEYKLSQQQRKSPSGNNTHLNPKKRLSPKSSPVRRPRGDTKKCRKVSSGL